MILEELGKFKGRKFKGRKFKGRVQGTDHLSF